MHSGKFHLLSILAFYFLFHDAVLLSPSGFDLRKWDLSQVTIESALLPDASRSILLDGSTEKSYTGRYLHGQRYNLKDEGIYVCALGGLPLFRSEHKFVSGTGWPSFYDVFDESHLIQIIEPNGTTEIVCARSGCHIGHVFPDTPPPALQRKFIAEGITKYDKKGFFRFCVNAGALKFVPNEKLFATEKCWGVSIWIWGLSAEPICLKSRHIIQKDYRIIHCTLFITLSKTLGNPVINPFSTASVNKNRTCWIVTFCLLFIFER